MDCISKRKDDHIHNSLSSVKSSLNAGFDEYRFEHCALPEINFVDIDTSVDFLGKTLSYPMIIAPITGGCNLSLKINCNLAQLAQKYNIAMGVGSQRIAIENPDLSSTFLVIRKYAPDIVLLANLGAVQLNYGYGIDECKQAIEMIEANGLILHLNPLQEIFQPEGNKNFSGLLKKIERICMNIGCPVIVKEVGYGISEKVAKQLKNAGVYAIDIAGAGNISWSEIEKNRSDNAVLNNSAKSFLNWGIPTAECIQNIKNVNGITKIASGGIKSGVDIAKSISLGADLCAHASVFLEKSMESLELCSEIIDTLIFELKTAMMCTGSNSITSLKKKKLIKYFK